MANITRDERERRKAAAETAAAAQNPTQLPQEITNEPDRGEPVLENPDEEVKTVVAEAPEQPRAFHTPTERDMEHYHEIELDRRKAKAAAAIEQAKKDAASAAIAKVEGDELTKSLLEDPGDTGKLVKFLGKFGPTNNAPPRPARTPYGDADVELMEWMAKYAPQEFLSKHGKRTSPVALRLIAQIQKELA